VKVRGAILRDKHGWPVEGVKGRWFLNLLRAVIHMNLWQTWSRRKKGYPKVSGPVPGAQTEVKE